MRDILFRGKTVGANSKFVYGNLILVDDYCCILERKEDLHPMDEPYLDGEIGWIDGKATPVRPETVGQFTGLHDKNGEKIFEGDVVKYPWVDVYGVSDTLMVVHYVDGEFLIKPISNDCGTDCWEIRISGENERTEIIGNIYDNPELMEAR